MLKMKIAVLMLIAFSVFTAHAQHRMPDGNIVGPGRNNNDNGDGFSQNIGADLYTGKLNAGFDVFSYRNKTSGLSHSITLSYDGGGNLVDNVASNIGANWSLYTGGYIAREVKGIPDEAQPGFTSSTTPVTPVGGLDSVTLMQYLTDRKDGQFDIYHFNAGGTSGRFIIGKNGEIQTIPRMNVSIEKTAWNTSFGPQMDSCNRSGFVITVDNGTRYMFSNFDCHLLDYNNGDHPYYTTGNWYLTRIISSFGTDTINFSYTATLGETIQTHKDFYSYVTTINGQPAVSNEFTGDIPPSQRVRRMIIDHIDYSDGTTVQFDYSYNRLDCKTDKALDAINIIKDGTGFGYKLVHSYMSRGFNGQPLTTADIPFSDYEHYNTSLWNTNNVETLYSLQLDSFYKYSGQQSLAGYGFKYNPICLPPIGSDQGVDMWGYFNGQNNERKTEYFDGSNTYHASFRIPNIQYTVAKSLQKISLPTGGAMRFTYEAHTTKSGVTPNDMGLASAPAIGGLRIKQIIYSDGTGQSNDMVKTYQYTETDGVTSSGVLANFPRFGYLYHEYYDGNPALPNQFNYNPVWLIGYNYYNYGTSPVPNYTNNTFLIRNGDPMNCILYTHGGLVGYGRVTEYAGTINNNIGKTVQYFTTADDYPVSASLLENNFPYPYIPDNDFAWGLTKSIENYNGAGLLLSKKQSEYSVYTYDLNNDNFRSLKLGLKNHPPHDLNDYGYKYYYPVTGKVFLTKQVGNKYYANNKMIRDSIIYNYDTAHNVVRYTITTNANDEQIKQVFYYPFDFSQSLAAIKAIQVNSADRSFPIRTEKWNLSSTIPRMLDVNVLVLDTISGVFYTYNGNLKYKGLVKPKAAYDFTPSQVVDANAWGSFNSAVVLPNQTYFTQTAAMDKYDANGNLVQSTSKGHVSSTIYDADQFPIASIQNAGVTDIAYTSFENNSFGNWEVYGMQPANISMPDHFVTGNNGYPVLYNSLARNNLNPLTKYTVTFWVYSGTPKVTATINGSSVNVPLTASDTHNGWKLYRAEITGAIAINVGANNTATIIDELRLYPSFASMSTISYHPLYGIISTCDVANHAAYNVVDDFGRLRYAKDADGNIRKVIDYKEQEAQY